MNIIKALFKSNKLDELSHVPNGKIIVHGYTKPYDYIIDKVPTLKELKEELIKKNIDYNNGVFVLLNKNTQEQIRPENDNISIEEFEIFILEHRGCKQCNEGFLKFKNETLETLRNEYRPPYINKDGSVIEENYQKHLDNRVSNFNEEIVIPFLIWKTHQSYCDKYSLR